MIDHPPAPSPVDYSPLDEDVLTDPMPAYERLRAECPVHRTDAMGRTLFSISRAEHVHGVLMDPGTWSNQRGPGIADSAAGAGDMQHDDPPEHTRRRGFARDWFNPSAVARLEDSIRSVVVALIDGVRPVGHAELYRDIALPLPVTSFCALMGIDIADRDRFVFWADELVVAMAYPERGRDARRELSAFTTGEVERRRDLADAGRRDELPPGLLSHLAVDAYTDDGERMPLGELVNMVNQLLIAGHETTTSLITNCVWRLLEDRPARWCRLLDEPDLVANAVEESLRFDPPVLGLCRTSDRRRRDRRGGHPRGVEADGALRIGQPGSRGFPDRPDEFVLDRPLLATRRHYSFSWGIHHCLGAHLARLTAKVAIEELLEGLPSLRLDGETERVGSPFLWGRHAVPIAWSVDEPADGADEST